MTPAEGFNQTTVDWQGSAGKIDRSNIPAYVGQEKDIETFQQDGVVLLRGTGNAEIKSMRRAFSSRWMGDDIRYCERAGETSPPYYTNHNMKAGDLMREDWFPVLWQSD